MSEISTITTGLTALKQAMDLVKLYKDAELSLDKAITKLDYAELYSLLADVKISLVEKNEEIMNLKSQLKLKTSMIFKDPVYFSTLDGVQDGPFCQQCYDNNSKLIRIAKSEDKTFGGWLCKTCKNYF